MSKRSHVESRCMDAAKDGMEKCEIIARQIGQENNAQKVWKGRNDTHKKVSIQYKHDQSDMTHRDTEKEVWIIDGSVVILHIRTHFC